MSNKTLWDSVKVTDPSAVKPITGKPYRGNSPKPYWLIERMTDTFGPVGTGWGVIVKSERFERMSETDVLHVAVVSIWYMRDGVRSESFDQMGGTKACYMTSSGKLMVDEDAGKKSVTDGMVKCLSMLGFCADIFSGMWDDSKYVEWASKQYEPDKNDVPQVKRNREKIITEAADIAIAKFQGGDEVAAYEAVSGINDNEEKLYLWNYLKPHSALRSSIKKLASIDAQPQKEMA